MLRHRPERIVAPMTVQTPQHLGRHVPANGIDIHYVEAGQGEPLLLLDNAMVSTNPIWASLPFAYASFLGTLAEHFRVIAPDTRGSGQSVHSGGPIPSGLLADDVVALIEALDLDQPLICGFSDGGETATLAGIRHPGSVRAITVPTLILTGDRDPFCTVEEGAAACRALQAGQLAVMPDTGHLITPAAVQTTIEFFERL